MTMNAGKTFMKVVNTTRTSIIIHKQKNFVDAAKVGIKFDPAKSFLIY